MIQKNMFFQFYQNMVALQKGLNHGYYRIIDHVFVLGSPHGGSPKKACKPHKEWCRGRGRLVDCVKKLVPSRRTIAETVFLVINPKNGFFSAIMILFFEFVQNP